MIHTQRCTNARTYMHTHMVPNPVSQGPEKRAFESVKLIIITLIVHCYSLETGMQQAERNCVYALRLFKDHRTASLKETKYTTN